MPDFTFCLHLGLKSRKSISLFETQDILHIGIYYYFYFFAGIVYSSPGS